MDVIITGNPNSGKTSLFNRLTGLNQQVGNYPGITVDKREGFFSSQDTKIHATDLPGIYSLYAGSEDERIAVEAILKHRSESKTPLFLCLIDIQSPHKNLLLLEQLLALGLPVLGIFNFRKKSTSEEVNFWIDRLQKKYAIPFEAVNANTGENLEELKAVIGQLLQKYSGSISQGEEYAQWVMKANGPSDSQIVKGITGDLRAKLEDIDNSFPADNDNETEIAESVTTSKLRTHSLDAILMHPIWGYVIFTASLLVIFQAVFAWSAYPMDWIESGFGILSSVLQNNLSPNFFTNALTDGLIPGLAGVVVFVPQIAFLFLFISLFEESGYMTRVVYLMDRLVKPFGLSGRSVVPLISGYACAIPAIMATRTIKHPREKLITMLVIPFMTCSARIPVYTTLIALMVSTEATYGWFNTQGLILFGLYFFGAFMSFFTALIAHKIMKGGGRSMLLMELPNYKVPGFKIVGLTIYEKSKSFVVQAGKVILLISLILYFMANLGFNETFKKIENNDTELVADLSPNEIAQLKLENSLIGQLGKTIEPVIRPLGYDWKIGISLITSFAAREVFVGTMSTIYALEEVEDDTSSIVQKMRSDTDANGSPKYSLAVILSLLVFYALAMQCLSTVAVMYKETGSWKWPIIQFAVSSGSAYLFAFIVYQLFR